jgi:hypothetical protein
VYFNELVNDNVPMVFSVGGGKQRFFFTYCDRRSNVPLHQCKQALARISIIEGAQTRAFTSSLSIQLRFKYSNGGLVFVPEKE